MPANRLRCHQQTEAMTSDLNTRPTDGEEAGMSCGWVETIDGWLLAIEKNLRRLYSREEEPVKRGKWGYQPPPPRLANVIPPWQSWRPLHACQDQRREPIPPVLLISATAGRERCCGLNPTGTSTALAPNLGTFSTEAPL